MTQHHPTQEHQALRRWQWPFIVVFSLLLHTAYIACAPIEPVVPPTDAGLYDAGQLADAQEATQEQPQVVDDAGPSQDTSAPEPQTDDQTTEPPPEPSIETVAQEATKPESTPDGFDFDKAVQRFESRYALTLLQKPSFPVNTRHGQINGKLVTTADIKAYAKLFFPEWQLYPPALIAKIRLKSVAFCTNLSFAGQARTAIPDMENHILYIDVKRGFYNAVYTRRTIHHELFHFIDFYDDYKLYEDKDWAALNPKGFKYGSGGQNAQDFAKASLLTDKHPGFFTTYSLSGVEEDKAEVFSILITLRKDAAERETKDPIIAAKIAKMKQLLVSFTPEMGAAFWQAVANKK